MQEKTFPFQVVAGIATGTLMSPMEDVYNLLHFLTGEGPMTHHIPHAILFIQELGTFEDVLDAYLDATNGHATWEEKQAALQRLGLWDRPVKVSPLGKGEVSKMIRFVAEHSPM